MKSLLLLIILVFTINTGKTQVYDTTTFKGKADYYLQFVDKSQIPAQILYDRVFPVARLDVFSTESSWFLKFIISQT